MNHGLPAGIPRPDKLLALTQQSRDNGVMHMHSPHGVSGRSEMTETLKKEGKESATVGVLDDNGAAVAGLRSGKVHVGELRQSEWFFGRNNSMHAAPSIYAVAGTVVGAVLRPNAQLLRHMDAEGAPWSSSNKSAPLSALKLGTLRPNTFRVVGRRVPISDRRGNLPSCRSRTVAAPHFIEYHGGEPHYPSAWGM